MRRPDRDTRAAVPGFHGLITDHPGRPTPIPVACTGGRDDRTGTLQHDGDTCPVHEAPEPFTVLVLELIEHELEYCRQATSDDYEPFELAEKVTELEAAREHFSAIVSAIPEAASTADLRFEDHGTIVLVRPLTDAGQQWIRETVGSARGGWYGGARVVGHQYVADIAHGAQRDGLEITS